MDGAHRISCERGSRAISGVSRGSDSAGRRRPARRCVPLLLSSHLKPSHRAPTPPRRRTRQGLDEDLHGACSARGSTTVCTAAPARRGRAAVGAGGGGAGRGARALSKDVPGSHRRRGRGRGVAPAGRRRRPRRPPPPRVAGAQRCAGGGGHVRHRRSTLASVADAQDYGGDTGAPFARRPRPPPPPPTRPDRRAARGDPLHTSPASAPRARAHVACQSAIRRLFQNTK